MSNALEAASLIMVPSGYENGTLASVKPNDGTGDFTFSRGSNLSATRINEQGYIEKGYENLLLQSNQFSTSPWAQANILPPTSGQTGYNGSSDAWYFEKVGAFGRLQQSISTSGVQTLSVYLKAKDSSWVNLETGGANTSRQYFDLTAPIETAKGFSNNIISSSIEDAGDGWRKCSITYEGVKNFAFVFPSEGNGQINGTSGSLYIQDAMLNQGLVAYPYIETTTAPVAGGILEDMPRLDWASGAPSLLLEPSRTNLATNSEYLDGMVQDNSDITNNSILSPEGVLNASKIEGQGGALYIRARRVVTLPAAGNYCFSIFAKAGTSSNFTIIISNYTATGNTSADFVLTGSGSTTSNGATIEPVGNGWYRCCVYPIMDGVDLTGNFYVYVGDDTGGIFFPSHEDTLGQNLYLYGMQVEQDATYPTSYIPTYGVSQTRLGDDMTNNLQGLDISSILGVSSYTIFFDVETENIGTSLNVAGNVCAVENPSLRLAIDTRVSVIQDDSSSTTRIKVDVGDNIKHYKGALQVTPTTAKIFGNGIEGQSGTSRNLSPDTLYVYSSVYNSDTYKMNKFILFPTALSDEECIQLTTV